MSDSERAPRISEILDGLASSRRKTVSVQDVLEAFGDRAFGALMFVFAAPAALPMPPGFSAILGAPLLFITAQLMVGRRTLWLPRVISGRTMKLSDFVSVMEKLSPYLTWL
ncbi:MAG: exopolysaccharide biosynthesis protein, partial [Caulobacterales bacterium]|nr:exopolysaccharide biosynthesis protein [Caulobacterales bacterium]